MSNSEIISQVIGDYPVLDQFDVSYSLLKSGSYLDDFVTGSLAKKIYINGKQIITTSNRGRVFSHISQNNSNLFFNDRFSYSKTLQPFSELSRTPYHSVLVDELERWYDTLMPSITETLSVDGSSLFEPAEDADTRTFLYTNTSHVASGTRGWIFFNWQDSTGDQSYTNSNWQLAFPYEPKYLNIARQEQQNNQLFVKNKLSFATAPYPVTAISPPKKVRSIMIVITNFFTTTLPNIQKFEFVSDISNNLTGSASLEEINKVYYGFGDKKTRAFYNNRYIGANNFPDFRKENNSYSLNFFSGPDLLIRFRNNYVFNPIIRGWKYGVKSGLPEFNKAYFRTNRFGQFRDMLEQRQSGKFFITDENLNIENSQKGIGQAAVTIKFVDQSGKLTKPENTWSQNLSIESTSSYPYFDGETKNRNEIILSSLNNNTINLNVSNLGRITL